MRVRGETSKGQESRIEGRGTEVKIHGSKTKGTVPGVPMSHCSLPVLWQRPESTASHGATDVFPNHKLSTSFFLPPWRRLRACALIASRAFSFVSVSLFVDQHVSFFLFFFRRVAQTTIYFASPTSEKRQLRDVRHDVHARRDGPEMLGQLGMDRFVIQRDTPLPIPDAVPDPG